MSIAYPKALSSPAKQQLLASEFRRDEMKRGGVDCGRDLYRSDFPLAISKLAQQRGQPPETTYPLSTPLTANDRRLSLQNDSLAERTDGRFPLAAGRLSA